MNDGTLTSPTDSQLVKHLLFGLSHRIRTSLSVITNELTYLESRYGKEDLMRARERCSDIAKLLRDLCSPFTAERGRSRCGLAELAAAIEIRTRAPVVIAKGAGAGNAAVDAETLLWIIEELYQFVSRSYPLQTHSFTLSVSGRLTLLVRGTQSCSEPSFPSLTDYFCRACGMDQPIAPVLDAALAAQGIKVEVEVADRLSIVLQLPVLA